MGGGGLNRDSGGTDYDLSDDVGEEEKDGWCIMIVIMMEMLPPKQYIKLPLSDLANGCVILSCVTHGN